MSGKHDLDFIVFDGGGEAGGMFRLETEADFVAGGGNLDDVQPPPVIPNEAPVADAGSTRPRSTGRAATT